MKRKAINPPALYRGDTIGIVAPASPPPDPEKIDKGIDYLTSRGYRIKAGKSIRVRNGYFAGSDDERTADIHEMFSDTGVKAIVALRGGYGSGRLLPALDYKMIRQNPKIFVGYSDITALHLAFFTRAQLITFSGPMLTADFGNDIHPGTESHFWQMVTGVNSRQPLAFRDSLIPLNSSARNGFSGTLIGGNLSILCSLIGTPYFPNLQGAVLALEDTGEAPYRIDRMFNQLRLCGVFEHVAAVLLGRFTNCDPNYDKQDQSFSLEDVFHQYFSDVSFPVLKNLPFGHEKEKLTLPIGANVTYDAASLQLILPEPAVSTVNT